MRVAEQLFVDALVGVVADALDPQLGAVGERAHERLELVRRQVARTRSRERRERAVAAREPAIGRGGERARRAHCASAPSRTGAWASPPRSPRPSTFISAGADAARSPRARRVASATALQSSAPATPWSAGSTTGRSEP